MNIINYKNPVVYQIINKANSHSYVGSSDRFIKRQKEHRNALRKGKHHSRYLQNAWNKYGEEQFTIIILETVLFRELLQVREQYWIDKLKPRYNCSKCVTAPMTGQNHTEEAREKMSLHRKGRKFLPEHKKHLSEAQTKLPRFTKEFLIDEYVNKCKTVSQIEKENGLTRQALYRDMDKYEIKRRNKSEAALLSRERMNPETRKWVAAKLAASLKNREISLETRRKMSIARQGKSPWNKGISLSEESKRKMSEAAKVRYARALV